MAESAMDKLKELQQKTDALTLRERALVAFSVVAVVYLLWSMVIQEPLSKEGKQLNGRLSSQAKKIQELETEVVVLSTMAGIDPDHDKKQKIAALESELTALDDSLSDISSGLISADQLAKVLENVLRRKEGLTLQRVQTLPVEALTLSNIAGNTTVDIADALSAGMFKHTVSLQLKGSYHQVVAYLQELESLPWRFYWDQLNYQVSGYPQAEVEIRVYTLSADEGLMGV